MLYILPLAAILITYSCMYHCLRRVIGRSTLNCLSDQIQTDVNPELGGIEGTGNSDPSTRDCPIIAYCGVVPV